jgi:hypothetical protein
MRWMIAVVLLLAPGTPVSADPPLSVGATSADLGSSRLHSRQRSSFEVRIHRGVELLVADHNELVRKCGPEAHRATQACTAFHLEGLECECIGNDRSWGLTERVRLVTMMYIYSFSFELHENLHIADIRGRLSAHARQLAAKSFDSRDSCDRAAEGERLGFDDLLATYIRQSNARLH